MKKANVLLVIHDVHQEDNSFPLGPAYLASMLEQHGVNVKVLCADVFHCSDEQIIQLIRFTHFDVIGLGFLAARFTETVLPLCKEIVRVKKNALLVLGGHGPSPIPKYMLEKTGADVVAIGEAEETLLDIVRHKVEKQSLDNVKGIAYKNGEDSIVNKRRKPVKDLDSLPFPAWDLFPMDEYTSCSLHPGQSKSEKSLAIISSRGCVGTCSFCFRLERGLRVRSMDNVIEEMKILQGKYNISYFNFQDEHFLFSKKRLFEFRDAVDKHKMKIKFFCNARVDLFDREIAECLNGIGCEKLNVGFESMDQQVLDAIKKHTTVEQNIQLAETAKEAGLNMGLNFMWGNPGDTEESLRKNVEFLKKYNTFQELRTIRTMSPYPGSPIYYEGVKSGLLKGPEDFFDKFKNSDLLTVNFTDIPEAKFYSLLFEANKELIINHCENSAMQIDEAEKIIQLFHNLYFEKECKFRGARHFERK